MLIGFRTWGRGPGRAINASVRVGDSEDAVSRVVARLERETGLRCCGGPRYDGLSLPEREPHYQITLGRPLRGGGYCPESEIWFAIENKR